MTSAVLRSILPILAAIVPSVTTVACAESPTTNMQRGAADSTPRNAPRAAVPTDPSSPRAALRSYLELAREGRYEDAARYLELPDSLAANGATIARRLKLVLDHHVWFDLDDVSPNAAGDTLDGLPRDVDQIAEIRTIGGAVQPVRLVRVVDTSAAAAWRFSAGTVARVPGWFDTLPRRWMIERIPDPLLRAGPFEILWWQWLVLPVLAALAAVAGAAASRVIRAVAGRAARRTTSDIDDALLQQLGGPLTLACAIVAARTALPWLELYQPAADAVTRVLRTGFLVAIFWALWRAIDVMRTLVARTPWGRASSASRTLLPLGARVSKVGIAAIAAISILSFLGYPVASLIAGLGIGGLAFALAAQKTVENLFGAFSIGADQPFREGDFVRVEDFVATVESIGLRSTRFRTLDRTIVTLPNGRLADMRLESYSARDRMRLATIIGVVYETTPAQMRDVLAGFERVLRSHPKIWPDAVVVKFSAFAASSLDIEIMAWFQTSDWSEFQRIREQILLQFMDVVESAGTAFAFPTTTVHVATVKADAPTPAGS